MPSRIAQNITFVRIAPITLGILLRHQSSVGFQTGGQATRGEADRQEWAGSVITVRSA
jgi:hypothetical protein